MSDTSDMLALANNIRDNNDFNGNGSWFWILILFFLIGGNGWNNRGDYATKANLYESANAQNTFSEFRSMQNEITRGFSDINQHLCNSTANFTSPSAASVHIPCFQYFLFTVHPSSAEDLLSLSG